jgi:Flp pilus assembly protein TadG
VEFALIAFPMLLLLSGIFGTGVVMVEYLQLTFVVQNAANAEVAKAGTGLAYAS